MEALGNLGRRVVAWLVIVVVAFIALKIVWGVVVGFAQTVLLIAALGVLAFALVWAMRRA